MWRITAQPDRKTLRSYEAHGPYSFACIVAIAIMQDGSEYANEQ
jgi:hypothetical protein